MKEPFGKTEALKLVQRIRLSGSTTYSGHAKTELAKDKMTSLDVDNILRCGAIRREADLENGSYRYRVETARMVVVVAFRSETELRIVTAWRKP
jgi:hypothetical protein